MPNRSSNIAIRRYQCRHIFTDGHRCGSPCLRDEDFCFYHHTTRRPPQTALTLHDPYNDPPNQTSFTLPIPEDRGAIQNSIGQIMNQLAGNALDPRRAGLLLYALQIASINLKNAPRLKTDDIVQEITLHPTQGPLAPKAEIAGDQAYRDFFQSLEETDDEEEDPNEIDAGNESQAEDEGDEKDEHEDEDEDEDEQEVEEEQEDQIQKSASISLSATAVSPARTPSQPFPRRRASPGPRRRYRAKSLRERTLRRKVPGGGDPHPA